MASVVHGGWKLIRTVPGGEELFHLATDPGDMTDRIADEPDEATRLWALRERFESGARRYGIETVIVPADLDRLRSLGYIE